MAALAATLTGRVLIQIGDGEPVEVGTVEIPIHVSTVHPTATRMGTARRAVEVPVSDTPIVAPERPAS